MVPPSSRRLRARQWELFVLFARPARSALLISGRRRTSISRFPIISTFSTSPARDPMLPRYGCTIYTVPNQRFQLSSLCISPLGFLSSGCSKLPQSMLYGRTGTTHAVLVISFSHSSPRMLATLTAILRLPSTSWTADLDALRPHDTRGSRHWFQRSSLRIPAALLTFLRLPSKSLLAVLNAIRLHVTRGSRHWFQPSSLCI
jgi:hypothetical protein